MFSLGIYSHQYMPKAQGSSLQGHAAPHSFYFLLLLSHPNVLGTGQTACSCLPAAHLPGHENCEHLRHEHLSVHSSGKPLAPLAELPLHQQHPLPDAQRNQPLCRTASPRWQTPHTVPATQGHSHGPTQGLCAERAWRTPRPEPNRGKAPGRGHHPSFTLLP